MHYHIYLYICIVDDQAGLFLFQQVKRLKPAACPDIGKIPVIMKKYEAMLYGYCSNEAINGLSYGLSITCTCPVDFSCMYIRSSRC